MAGTTLALDFPNLGDRTMRLFERLNAIVLAAGGRIYPAKDACMTREMFERGYPRLAEFSWFRDPAFLRPCRVACWAHDEASATRLESS